MWRFRGSLRPNNLSYPRLAVRVFFFNLVAARCENLTFDYVALIEQFVPQLYRRRHDLGFRHLSLGLRIDPELLKYQLRTDVGSTLQLNYILHLYCLSPKL
jgi:hypothetical protein